MSATEASGRRYRIAEVSRLTGFTPTTLRYYEDAGVVAPPERTAAGYRAYDDRAVERLRLVSRAKDLGCTLEEIAGLVEAWDADDCGPVKHRLRVLVTTKVEEIERHIAEQHAFAAQLRETATLLASRPVDGPCDDTCGCATPALAGTADDGCASGCGCATTAGDPDDVPPIACTLGGGEVETRLEEWRTLLDGVSRTPIPNGVRLAFSPPAPLGEIARLAGAEQACCAFFTFAISVGTAGVTMDVVAPADGGSVLEALFGTT